MNTYRGEINEENALIQALKNGRIAGSALGVLECELLDTSNELFGMENVFLTLNMSSLFSESAPLLRHTAIENALSALIGKLSR